mmetsp:Transcript_28957/g.69193  ORF Transcript_28957/g.69193 Transcript_28957/m.69193 type:complete len:409 (-) Transcript_28957:348-1574(-)
MSVFRGLRYCSKFLGGEICLENRCALTGELCNCFERWYSSSPKSAENSSRSLASSSTVRNPPQLGGYLRTGADVHEGCPKILVTGASGQVGAEFVPFLRDRFGRERVVPSDVRTSESASDSTCVYCDVQDKDGLTRLVLENEITTIVHLASVLSAVGERNPQLALRVNTNGIQNVLDIAAAHGLQVFAPSTIAVFGPSTPRHGTPDAAVKEPRTMYGITKVHQELLGAYYTDKFGVDFRSLRYPGIVSSKSMPGGGTTDYAVDIFHAALRTGKYVCFLGEETALPMVYMPDCLEGTLRLMTAPKEALTQTTYNVASMSFTPRELAESIRRFIPGFELRCLPDFREEIARSWPASIDDSRARRDWGWSPEFDLDAMTAHMLHEISNQMSAPGYGAKPDRGSRLSAAVAG